MTEPEDRDSVGDLRSTWRKGEDAARGQDASPDVDADRRRQDDALESNDRIRDDAPDDLETRRAADQLEREIKRAREANEP